jgi:hypothetical protein
MGVAIDSPLMDSRSAGILPVRYGSCKCKDTPVDWAGKMPTPQEFELVGWAGRMPTPQEFELIEFVFLRSEIGDEFLIDRRCCGGWIVSIGCGGETGR